jgi:hypothetical protein
MILIFLDRSWWVSVALCKSFVNRFDDDFSVSWLLSSFSKTSFRVFFWINHQHNTKRVTKNFLLSLCFFIRTMGTHGTLRCVFLWVKRWWFLAFLCDYINLNTSHHLMIFLFLLFYCRWIWCKRLCFQFPNFVSKRDSHRWRIANKLNCPMY